MATISAVPPPNHGLHQAGAKCRRRANSVMSSRLMLSDQGALWRRRVVLLSGRMVSREGISSHSSTPKGYTATTLMGSPAPRYLTATWLGSLPVIFRPAVFARRRRHNYHSYVLRHHRATLRQAPLKISIVRSEIFRWLWCCYIIGHTLMVIFLLRVEV